jgi:hypothetical protein
MRKRFSKGPAWGLAAAALWAAGLAPHGAAREKKDDQAVADTDVVAWVARRVEERQPAPQDRRFDEVGWAKDLRTAIRLGKESGRPLFLFTMDGRINTGRC